MNKELRSLHIKELRVSKADDGTRTISGIVTYNTPSLDLGGFVEILAPGCFAGSLSGDVLCLRDHDAKLLMGRTKSGTLTLTDTADGLQFVCKLPQTSTANDLAESIDRGDLDGVSFGFIVPDDGDDWAYADGQLIRTIKEAELLEISPCSWAAYPANSVSVRSCPNELRSHLAQRDEVEESCDQPEDRGDECQCSCQPCQDGNCAECTDDPCDCDGCDCNLYRCLRAQYKYVFKDNPTH